MSAPIFIRLPPDRAGRIVSHRLLTIGDRHHVTGCRWPIDATLPLILTPTRPPRHELCPACARDLDCKMVRVPAVELGLNVREVGVLADVAVTRTRTTQDLKRPGALDRDAVEEWSESAVPEVVIRDLSSRGVTR